MRGRRKKLNPHPLPVVPYLAYKHHPTFQFFLGDRVFQHNHLAVIHFILQQDQAAVRIDHHGIARFLEFLAIVRAALRLDANLVKNSCAAPGRHCRCRRHFAHTAIFDCPPPTVNWPPEQVFRISNLPSGRKPPTCAVGRRAEEGSRRLAI